MKMMKKTLMVAAIGALGVGSWMAYKKYNPNAKEDLKKVVRTMSNNKENIIENMM